jgi:hypothetical protein
MSHVILVDLAGVERNQSVFDNVLSNQTLHESKNINLSLSTLLRCFRALRH